MEPLPVGIVVCRSRGVTQEWFGLHDAGWISSRAMIVFSFWMRRLWGCGQRSCVVHKSTGGTCRAASGSPSGRADLQRRLPSPPCYDARACTSGAETAPKFGADFPLVARLVGVLALASPSASAASISPMSLPDNQPKLCSCKRQSDGTPYVRCDCRFSSRLSLILIQIVALHSGESGENFIRR